MGGLFWGRDSPLTYHLTAAFPKELTDVFSDPTDQQNITPCRTTPSRRSSGGSDFRGCLEQAITSQQARFARNGARQRLQAD
eukprot:1327583-Rhodomonas_salina.2